MRVEDVHLHNMLIKQSAPPLQNNSPKVSIIIVTYNAANTLQECLDSIYSQCYLNTEIIIMDGQSTDGTLDILQQNSKYIHYWESEKDHGIYDAMNKALEHITGDWVYFIGSDDIALPGFSDLANELKDSAAIYHGTVICKGKIQPIQTKPYKIAKYGMHHQAMFYPVSIFKKRKYNLDYPISADVILNMECWKDKNINWIFKNHVVAIFNHGGISSRFQDPILLKRKAFLVLKNYGFVAWIRLILGQTKRKILKKEKELPLLDGKKQLAKPPQ